MLDNRGDDTFFNGLSLGSEELDGINQDNQGTGSGPDTFAIFRGVWRMIEENGFSRVYLGVR
jgi:hypothetical protein